MIFDVYTDLKDLKKASHFLVFSIRILSLSISRPNGRQSK